jgi:outer membrane protein assembly factor BamD
MRSSRRSRGARLCLAWVAALACSPAFKLRDYPTHESLWGGSMREFNARRWDNAIVGFERLTLELPARDTLLPRAHFYLGQAHARRAEHLLAAQSFQRLAESFPDDSLADDALLAAGNAYQRLWRKPTLDAQYGFTAAEVYRQLVELYPDSPLREQAQEQVDRLTEWFATKDYETGLYYMRRKAYDPAIIYFRDVVGKFPTTDRARQAYLRLVDAYREINYRDDARETCATLWEKYPNDREVRETCGPRPPPATVARPDSSAT